MILGLTTGDLVWLACAALAGGLVRGFAGFGTAMVYLPLAAQVLSPVQTIITLIAMDILGPIPNLPGAWRDANRPDLARLMTGVALGLPVGIFILTSVSPDTYRTAVSMAALILVVLLVAGLRYSKALPSWAVFGVGGTGGVLGGFTGMPGPPVILTYLAGPHPVTVVRGMTMLYLYCFDAMMLVAFALKGMLSLGVLLLGICLGIPNMLGNVIGARAFRPGKERLYRNVAYAVISIAALSSLPIWE